MDRGRTEGQAFQKFRSMLSESATVKTDLLFVHVISMYRVGTR